MDDLDIEELILDAIIKVYETTDAEISLNGSSYNDYISVYFDADANRWIEKGTEVDFLSCVLLYLQPHPNFNSDDNTAVSTLMKMFDRSSGWVRSFQFGCRGLSNSSTSITGYIIGWKMVKLYAEYNNPIPKLDD